MPIEFKCHNCRTIILIKYLKPGEVASCKNCNALNIVPHDPGVIGGIPTDDSSKKVEFGEILCEVKNNILKIPEKDIHSVYKKWMPLLLWFISLEIISSYTIFRLYYKAGLLGHVISMQNQTAIVNIIIIAQIILAIICAVIFLIINTKCFKTRLQFNPVKRFAYQRIIISFIKISWVVRPLIFAVLGIILVEYLVWKELIPLPVG